MNHRKNIISYWCTKNNTESYLELGLQDPNQTFNHIPAKIKHSVDINDKFATYNMSTDDFFKKLNNAELDLDPNYKWDLVFIDANHLADFVIRDIFNSLNHLSDKGIIFLHDILPQNYSDQTELGYNQTAWKVVPYILKNHPELHICTFLKEYDQMGVIIRNPLNNRRVVLEQNFNQFYEYYIMNNDRETSQNQIKYEELEKWMDNPYYQFKEQNILSHINIYKDIIMNKMM